MSINKVKMCKIQKNIKNSRIKKTFKNLNKIVDSKAVTYRQSGTKKSYNKLIEADMKRNVFIFNLKNGMLE